jgi:hypothetical protein
MPKMGMAAFARVSARQSSSSTLAPARTRARILFMGHYKTDSAKVKVELITDLKASWLAFVSSSRQGVIIRFNRMIQKSGFPGRARE